MDFLEGLAVYLAVASALVWIAVKSRGTKIAWPFALLANCGAAYSASLALETLMMQVTGAIPGGQPWPVITWAVSAIIAFKVGAMAKPSVWLAVIPCWIVGALMILVFVVPAPDLIINYPPLPGSRWATPAYVLAAEDASGYGGAILIFIGIVLLFVLKSNPRLRNPATESNEAEPPLPSFLEAIKSAGSIILGIAVLIALIFVSALFILGTATVSEKVLPFLNVATIISLIFCVIVLLPLLIVRATRFIPVWGLFIASYVFGVDVWMYGFLVTFDLWGAGGVFAGLLLGVVGIVPLGIIAAALHALWSTVGELAFGIAITYGARMFAVFLAATLDRATEEAA